MFLFYFLVLGKKSHKFSISEPHPSSELHSSEGKRLMTLKHEENHTPFFW